MNYEQKYKEALEKARQFSEHPLEEDSSSIVEYIFPELAESEDEKIIKELITHCRNTRCVTEEGAERIAKWIAWLEKQGTSYTKKDVDNAFVEGMAFAKDELEKQGEQNPVEFKWSADDKNKLLIIEQVLNCANLLISSQELTETKNWLKSLKQRMGG